MRWLARIALLGLLGVGLVLGGIALYFDRLIGTAIETGGSYALGVETTVDSVLLRPLSGRLHLSGLRVRNPSGFQREEFISLESGSGSVELASLRTDVLVIPSLELSGLEVSIEQTRAGTNYDRVLQSLDKLAADSSDTPETGRRVVIRELVIRNITAHTRLLAAGRALPELDLEVPEIRMTNLGEKQGGMRSSEVVALVTGSVLSAIARKQGALPADLAASLDRRLGGIERSLRDGVGSIAGEAVKRGFDTLRGWFGSDKD